MENDQIRPAASKPAAKSEPPRALGRGLGALLPSQPPSGEAIRQIPVSQINPNPYQTRRHFDPERLRELADSIRVHGVVQPIVVRRVGDRYLLIAGERRWRAATLAGLAAIPAILRDVPENQVLELTLIENIQREDLNPIETAEAFARLSNELGLTHDQIAVRTGKDRPTVTNFLRLLKLPREVRDRVDVGELSMGHARALLGLRSEAAQIAMAIRIVEQALSVRQAEELIKKSTVETPLTIAALEKEAIKDPNVQAAVQEMERALGTRVRLTGNDMKGKIIIEYYTSEDLDRVYHLIVGLK